MGIADKIVDSADKAADKIAETTDKVTGRIADKFSHDEPAPGTGTHRGEPADEQKGPGMTDKIAEKVPGIVDKLTDATERAATKFEEAVERKAAQDMRNAPRS
jgi:hypothetical protein